MKVYPLDYQLSLSQTIRARLLKVTSEEQAARLREALARLHLADFGECARCGGVIPYPEIAADPAAQACRTCRR
jgi:RNA polymerase-binding transcription factor DksA